jgi:effector-binding domain-containing protein
MRFLTPLLAFSLVVAPVAGFAQAPASGGIGTPPPVESAPLPAPPPGSTPEPTAAPTTPVQSTPAQTTPAQTTPATPSPTPPAASAPSAPVQAGPGPTVPSPGASAPVAGARPTLVPGAGDPVDVNEVVLPGKPAAILSGTSTWDEGFTSLKNAFRKIEEELTRAGIAPAGRPLTVFVQTDDLGFRYDAMVPVPSGLEGRPALSPEVRFGKTPEGKALRFVHKEAYDEIDETYETITAYLDAKNVTVKDMFIEEYVTDLTDSTDANLEINIFVQPKE